jgi:hypothetical protein
MKFAQFETTLFLLKKHYAARLLQKLRKKYLLKLQLLKKLSKEMWSDFKIVLIIKIQSLFRGWKSRIKTKLRKKNAKKIIKLARDYVIYKFYLKNKKAKKHFKEIITIKSFHKLKKFYMESLKKVKLCYEKIAKNSILKTKKRSFKILKFLFPIFKEDRFDDTAIIIWQINICKKIIKYWKKTMHETYNKNRKLLIIFTNCIDLSTQNSFRQKSSYNRAVDFYRKKLILPYWKTLCREYLIKKSLDLLDPIAKKHFNMTFFNRMCFKILYFGFKKHVENKKFKRNAKMIGENNYVRCKTMPILKRLKNRNEQCKKQKKLIVLHRNFHEIFSENKKIQLFLYRTQTRKKMKNNYQKAIFQNNNWLFDKGFLDFRVNIIKMFIFTRMNKKAELKYISVITKKIWKAWNEYKTYSEKLWQLYAKRYLDKLVKKVLVEGFKKHVLICRQEQESFLLSLQKQHNDEEKISKILKNLQIFQAKIRGFLLKQKYQIIRVTKLSAIQQMQNFIRVYLAKKKFLQKIRHVDLRDLLREEKEVKILLNFI